MKKLTVLLLAFLLVFLCCSKKEMAQKHFKKGFAFHNDGKYAEAATEYKKAIEKDSTLVEAYVNLASIYFVQQKYDQAQIELENALRYNPYHVKAHYNLGLILINQGKKEEAKKHYEYLKSIKSSLAGELEKRMEGE